MVLLAPAGRADDDLHFFKNYFVTGDYAVAGVGLYGKGVNGLATGTINISGVPQGADIIAAFLYWETVESTPAPSSINGFFDFDSNNKPNPIVGAVIGSPQTAPCWSSGGTAGLGLALRVYRADVLRYLAVDSTNRIRLANGAHTVKLPDSGLNGNGSTPHTEGASLVVVYRMLPAGAAPYKAVVIYDGASTMTKSSNAFMVTIGGFYDAAGSGGRMTYIVGNGQPGFPATITVNTKAVTNIPSPGTPFVGAQGPRWDNLTFAFNQAVGASSLQTQVMSGSNQVCLSWGAVVTSTNVVNTDGDGLLDSWKTKGLHLNIGDSTHPATFGGCADYPNEPCENLPAMGAVLGTKVSPHKDVFLQIDWMDGGDHLHIPKLAALESIGDVFKTHGIAMHFDVGNNYQGNPYIVPTKYAQGGHPILESLLGCPNALTTADHCAFIEPYSVMGWKKGLDAIKNGFPILNISPHFAHDRKDIFHYVLFGHALAGPFDAAGKPLTKDPSSVSGIADTPGGDVLITLGLWRATDPIPCIQGVDCIDETGSALVQAGTLMHELGHNLGLYHGGAVRVPNCMPDYPSVMNYLYQTRGLTDVNGIEHIDYSRGLLGGLDENSLSETASLGPLMYRVRYYAPANSVERSAGSAAKAHCDATPLNPGESSVRLETPGLGTPDWNNDGKVDAVTSPVDINFNGFTGDPVKDSVDPADLNISDPNKPWFIDHNDWSNINLQQIGGRLNVAGLSDDVGPSDIGQSDFGQSDFGQSDFGQSDFGQSDFGQSDFGQSDFGQSDRGDVDYDTAISTLDATGSNTPLVATPTASVPLNGNNQITLNWGAPSLGQITNYTIYRTNLDAAQPTPTVAGTVSNIPPSTTFNDPVKDMSPADSGATCPSAVVCYNTNYQYFITATDVRGTTSIPSNFATAIVDHLFVTAFSGSVVYGNTLPNFSSSAATITGLVSADLTSSAFTCTNSTGSNPPRNVGAYPITCTGPAAVGAGTFDGVTYVPGTLTITVRPLNITAQPNTKTYDGTTSASAIPVPAVGTPSSGSGLVNGDTVTQLVETYDTPGAGNNKMLLVSATYQVIDQNSGNNYSVSTTPYSPGVIKPFPLTVTSTGVNKVYDGGTSATVTLSDNRIQNVGDTFTDSYTGASFASKNVGNSIQVNVSGISISGTGTGNYTLLNMTASTTANITPAPLTVGATGVNKFYDGGTGAAVTLSDNRIPNVGDTFTDSYVSASFVTASAGTGIAVNVAGLSISGTGAGNYTLLNLIAITTANISPAPLTATATGVDKVYDGTTTATVTFSDNRVQNVGDTFTYNYTANFATPNVGTGIVVNVTGIALTGPGAGNYTLGNTTTASTSANITPAPLTAIVTGVESGGPPPTTFTVGSVTYSGFVSPDTSSIVIGTLSCIVSAAADTAGNYPISCSGLSAPNYNISYSYSVGPVNVSPVPLTVAVNGTQPVGGTPTFTVTYSGFVGSDTAAVVTGTLSCITNATPSSPVGSYAILSCSGLSAPNTYVINYWLGTVNVM